VTHRFLRRGRLLKRLKLIHYPLLRSGMAPNLRDQDGLTLLITAVRQNALDCAKSLLDVGADVDATAVPSPKLGGTALSSAVGAGNQAIIRLLWEAGARH
jgi:ankyrin repeat protein